MERELRKLLAFIANVCKGVASGGCKTKLCSRRKARHERCRARGMQSQNAERARYWAPKDTLSAGTCREPTLNVSDVRVPQKLQCVTSAHPQQYQFDTYFAGLRGPVFVVLF